MHSDDTLAHYLSRPFFNKVNYGVRSSKDTAERLKQCVGVSPLPKPETDAFTFYLLNHAFQLVRMKFHPDEPLGEYAEVVDLYLNKCIPIAQRALHYLLVICTRESRHVKDVNGIYQTMQSKWGPQIKDFNWHIRGSSSESAVQKFIDSPPNDNLGKYAAFLPWVFYTGVYSSGFGGPKWGAVADCFANCVTGKSTMEVMLDTVWTLAHNGGPIFNKGVIYSGYSSVDLRLILDVQRAGMIPQLIANPPKQNVTGLTTEHKTMHTYLRDKFFKGEFAGEVDWKRVMALGSIGQYDCWVKEPEVAPVIPTAPPKPTEPDLGSYMIDPMTTIKIVSRKKAKEIMECANG